MQLLRAGSAGSTDEPRINRIHNVRAARSLASRRSTSSSLLQPLLLLFLLLAFSSLARPARCCGRKTRHPSSARGETWPSGASWWRVAINEAAAGAAAGAAGRSPSCCRRSFTWACALHSNASPPHSHVQHAHFLPLYSFIFIHAGHFSQVKRSWVLVATLLMWKVKIVKTHHHHQQQQPDRLREGSTQHVSH